MYVNEPVYAQAGGDRTGEIYNCLLPKAVHVQL